MIEAPSKLEIGPRWLRDAFNALLEYAIKNHIQATSGLFISETPLGLLLSTTPGGGGSGTAAQPLALYDATDKNGPRIGITYGTIGGEPINGMSPGDDPPYSIPIDTGNGLVYAIVTVDDNGSITSVTADTGDKLPDDTDTESYIEIGSYNYDQQTKSLSLANNLTGSQSFSRCRDWFSNPPTYSFQYGVI
jgi:hypothetical protein